MKHNLLASTALVCVLTCAAHADALLQLPKVEESGNVILPGGALLGRQLSDKSISPLVTQQGSAAIQRTMAAKLGETVSITDFAGADPSGASFSDAALSAAEASLGSQCGRIKLPRGTFKFSKNIAYTYPVLACALTFDGDGPSATELYWPSAAGGLTFNFQGPANEIHFKDLAITTDAADAGEGVRLYRARNYSALVSSPVNTFVNVAFANHAHDMTVPKYWSRGLGVHGVNLVVVDKAQFQGGSNGGDGTNGGTVPPLGIGFSVEGTGRSSEGNAQYGVIYQLTNSYLQMLDTGFYYGDYVQGVVATSNNWGYVKTCIRTVAHSAGLLAQLALTNNQMGQNFGTCVDLESAVFTVNMHNNNIFVQPGQIGVKMVSTTPFNSSGNQIFGRSTGKWKPLTSYAAGTLVDNSGNTYSVVTGGTSAASGGPTGTGLTITDGGVTWKYVAASAVGYQLGPSPVAGGFIGAGDVFRGLGSGINFLSNAAGIEVAGTSFSNNATDVSGSLSFIHFGFNTWSDIQYNPSFLGGTDAIGSHNSNQVMGPNGGGKNVSSTASAYYARDISGNLVNGNVYLGPDGTLHIWAPSNSHYVAFDKGPISIGTNPVYTSGGAGVTCSGPPTASYAVTGGIVTHC